MVSSCQISYKSGGPFIGDSRVVWPEAMRYVIDMFACTYLYWWNRFVMQVC